jgi:hypothetical protein
MHRLRLLIVDPSTTTRRIVRNLLREIGFTQIDELPNARVYSSGSRLSRATW